VGVVTNDVSDQVEYMRWAVYRARLWRFEQRCRLLRSPRDELNYLVTRDAVVGKLFTIDAGWKFQRFKACHSGSRDHESCHFLALLHHNVTL